MSSLGDLYFALGLDDTKFNDALEAAKKKVADLGADVNVGINLELDTAKVAEQVKREIDKISGRSPEVKTGVSVDTAKIENLKALLKETEKEAKDLREAFDKATTESGRNKIRPDLVRAMDREADLKNRLAEYGVVDDQMLKGFKTNLMEAQSRLRDLSLEYDEFLQKIKGKKRLSTEEKDTKGFYEYNIKNEKELIADYERLTKKATEYRAAIEKQVKGGSGLKPLEIEVKANLDTLKADLAKAEELIKPLAVKAQLDKDDFNKVRVKLDELGHPVDVKITLDYDLDKFRAVETAINNYTKNLTSTGTIKLGIDDAFLRTGVSESGKGVKGWMGRVSDYLLGDDTGDAAKSIKSIQKILDNHPFKIRVTFDENAVIASLSKKTKSLPIKVDVDAAEIQKKLKAMKTPLAFNVSQAISEVKAELKKASFKAKLNLVIDKASVTKAIKEAFAKKGLEYQASPGDVRNMRILEIQQKMEHRQKKFDGQVKKSAKSTDKLGSSMRGASDWASQLTSQFNNFISIYSIERFIRNLYTIGGEFQKQQIALQNMIGEAGKANAVFERMKDLSVKSPFTFSELSSYTKQMSAYGIEYEELYDTTKRLADISAGVGVDMSRIILAYGQVRSAEVLRGQELRQFTEAGIPLVQELAKRLGEVRGEAVKVGEVFEAISKREITFGMVKDVLFDMTDPGGRFFEMQEELAKSLAGQWSNLKDAWDIMIADIANSTNNVLSGLAGVAADLLRNWRDWVPALVSIATAIGVVTTAIRAVTIAQNLWNAATSANPWMKVIGLILAAVSAVGGWVLASDIAAKNTSQLNSELEEEIQKWNENRNNALRYVDTLKSSNTEDERRIRLYNELIKLYPELFRNMTLEQLMLADTANLKTAINNETAKQQLERIDKDLKAQQDVVKEINDSRKRKTASGSVVVRALTDEEKQRFEDAKAQIAHLESLKVEIQKAIDREGRINKLTPDSSLEKYIEVYGRLGKAVKVLRQGGVKGLLANPEEFTTTLEFYNSLNSALKEQEEITQKFAPNTQEYKDAAKLVGVYRKAIEAIGGVWETSKPRGSGVDEQAKLDAQAYIEALKRELSEMAQKWNLFQMLMDATGKKDLSMRIAFDDQMQFASPYLDALKKRLEEEARKLNVNMSVADLLMSGEKQLMNDQRIPEADREKVAKSLGAIIEMYHNESKRLKEETVRDFVEIVKSSRDFAEQIEAVERELQGKLDKLSKIHAKGTPEYEKAAAELINNAEEEKTKIRFEEFKKSSDWVKVFDDLDRVSNDTLDNMIVKVEEFAKQAGLSEEVTKQLVEAMAKLRNEAIERNPFEGFKDALERLKYYKSLQGKVGEYDEDGNLITQQMVDDGVAAANKDLENSALGVAQKFEAVAQAADLLGGLFDSMGLGASEFMSAISDVIGGVTSGASTGASIASAFGYSGPWGAIIGAAIGGLTALFGQVDKSLQRAIESSERREEHVKNISDNLSKALERNLGGIYTMKLDDDTISSFTKVIDDYETALEAAGKLRGGEFNMDIFRAYREFSHLQDDTIQSIKNALNENSYFDAQLASLKIQRDEVQKQMSLEDEKKKTNKDKMADYEQEIKELDDAIKHFAQDMAEALYGIDFKDWANQLAESLVDAWASGEDAVQAYKDTVDDILRDLGVSIISQKIIEPLLSKTMDDFLAQFEKDNGKLTDDSMEILTGMYDQAEYAADATAAYLEGLKKLGIELEDKEESSAGGLSKGIQSVTEETADLLASYLNAMRADVSVKRTLIEKLVSEDVPKMNYLAEAQLQQLQMISANTKRNADVATEIRDLVNRVVDKGSNKLKI